MNNARTRGATSGTCILEKRRIVSLSFLAIFFLCFSAGDLFLPSPAFAAEAGGAVKSTAKAAEKNHTAKKPVLKTTTKRKQRGVFARSLASEEKRASLRERGISSGFGPRAISRTKIRMHKGIDVPAPKGSKVLAYNDGEVIFAGVKNGYGRTVILRQIDGREALYAHMSKYVVSVGDQLKRGDHVGHVGRTGRATGCHLHFEIIDEGENLDPALHVWHGSELVLGPGDLNPDAPGQTKVASPGTRMNVQLH